VVDPSEIGAGLSDDKLGTNRVELRLAGQLLEGFCALDLCRGERAVGIGLLALGSVYGGVDVDESGPGGDLLPFLDRDPLDEAASS
jgi:hypothetical protein